MIMNRDIRRLEIIISEDNEWLNRLLELYTIAKSHQTPNDIIQWYDFSELESIITKYPNSENSGAYVVSEFMRYLKHNYNIDFVVSATFFDEGYLLLQGYSIVLPIGDVTI